MSDKNHSNWRRIQEVFSAVADLPTREQKKEIEKLANGDLELIKEVQSLLEYDCDSQIICKEMEPQSPYRSGQQIDRFRLIFPLASNTTTEVWKAISDCEPMDSPRRFAAVKILSDTQLQKRHQLRFAQEANILAQFEHVGIAKFLGAGTTRFDHPYVATEFVDGKDIYRFATDKPLDLRHRLELVMRVCEAVEFSHQQLVIHRDLKPENILVDRSGQPIVIDFGISKRLQDQGLQSLQLTQTLDRPMTPAYASPEQVRGEPVSALTDVYAIGLILYQLVTGIHPYTDWAHIPDTPLFDRITSANPRLPTSLVVSDRRTVANLNASTLGCDSPLPEEPRRLQRALASGLQSIIMKAIEKRPEDRYQSVSQLRSELSLFLSGQSLHRTTPVQFAKGNTVFSLTTAMIIGVALGLIPWLWQISSPSTDADRNAAFLSDDALEMENIDANRNEKFSRSRSFQFDRQMEIAEQAIRDREYFKALQIANKLNDGSEQTLIQRFQIANLFYLMGMPRDALSLISMEPSPFEINAVEEFEIEDFRHLYCLILIQCGQANHAREINNQSATSANRSQLQIDLIEALVRESNNWFEGVKQLLAQRKSELVFAQLPASDRNHFARLIAQYSDGGSGFGHSAELQDMPGAWTRTELQLEQAKQQLKNQKFDLANETLINIVDDFQSIGLPHHLLLARAIMLSENFGQNNLKLQSLAIPIVSNAESQTPETVRLFTHLLGRSKNEAEDFKRFKKRRDSWMAIDNQLYKFDLLREVWRGALEVNDGEMLVYIENQLVGISREFFGAEQIELADALSVQSVLLAMQDKDYRPSFQQAKAIIQHNQSENSENLAVGFLDAVDLESAEKFVRYAVSPGFRSSPDWLFEFRMHRDNPPQDQLTMILHFIEHGSSTNAGELLRLIDSTLHRIEIQKLSNRANQDAVSRLRKAKLKLSSK